MASAPFREGTPENGAEDLAGFCRLVHAQEELDREYEERKKAFFASISQGWAQLQADRVARFPHHALDHQQALQNQAAVIPHENAQRELSSRLPAGEPLREVAINGPTGDSIDVIEDDDSQQGVRRSSRKRKHVRSQAEVTNDDDQQQGTNSKSLSDQPQAWKKACLGRARPNMAPQHKPPEIEGPQVEVRHDHVRTRDGNQRDPRRKSRLTTKARRSQKIAAREADPVAMEMIRLEKARVDELGWTKTIGFEQVWSNGTPTDHIVTPEDHPTQSDGFFILRCQECNLSFRDRPIPAAAKHGSGMQHQLPGRMWDTALEIFGIRVLNCDAEKATRNNIAFRERLDGGFQPNSHLRSAKPRPNIAQAETAVDAEPALDGGRDPAQAEAKEVSDFVEKEKEDGGWEDAEILVRAAEVSPGTVVSIRTSDVYDFGRAAICLPVFESLETIGITGTLADLDLAATSKSVPACYTWDRRTHKITGWAEGYEDGGAKQDQRRYPFLICKNMDVKIPPTGGGMVDAPKPSSACWKEARVAYNTNLESRRSSLPAGFEIARAYDRFLKEFRAAKDAVQEPSGSGSDSVSLNTSVVEAVSAQVEESAAEDGLDLEDTQRARRDLANRSYLLGADREPPNNGREDGALDNDGRDVNEKVRVHKNAGRNVVEIVDDSRSGGEEEGYGSSSEESTDDDGDVDNDVDVDNSDPDESSVSLKRSPGDLDDRRHASYTVKNGETRNWNVITSTVAPSPSPSGPRGQPYDQPRFGVAAHLLPGARALPASRSPPSQAAKRAFAGFRPANRGVDNLDWDE